MVAASKMGDDLDEVNNVPGGERAAEQECDFNGKESTAPAPADLPLQNESDENPEGVNEELELNGVLKAFLLIWIVFGALFSFIQLFNSGNESLLLNVFGFGLVLIGILGFAGMYEKKRWGLILVAIFYLIQIILFIYSSMADATYMEELLKVFVKVIVVCALLCLRKNGVSAWRVIWNNGEIKPTVTDQKIVSDTDEETDDVPPIPIDNCPNQLEELPTIPTEDVLPQSPVVNLENDKSNIKLASKVVDYSNNHNLSARKRKVIIWAVSILVGLLMVIGLASAIIIVRADVPDYVHGYIHKVNYALSLKDDAIAWELYGLAKKAEQDDLYELARDYMKEAYERVNKDPILIRKLLDNSTGEYRLLKEARDLCLRLDYKRDVYLMSELSFFELCLNNEDTALRLAQEAYLMNKDSAKVAATTLYLAYLKKQDWTNVLKWTAQSLEYSADFAQTHYVRAKALYELKDFYESYNSYTRGLMIDLRDDYDSYGKDEYYYIVSFDDLFKRASKKYSLSALTSCYKALKKENSRYNVWVALKDDYRLGSWESFNFICNYELEKRNKKSK